jgi:hypothetical protein
MIILVLFALLGFGGFLIGHGKGVPGLGALLGLLLGPVGWVIVALRAQKTAEAKTRAPVVQEVKFISGSQKNDLLIVLPIVVIVTLGAAVLFAFYT